MKCITQAIRIALPLVVFTICIPTVQGQVWKKLKKKAEKAAERTVERRVEKETSKKTDEVLDSILEPGKKGKTPTDKDGVPIPQGEIPDQNESSDDTSSSEASGPKSIEVYSKFDFVPGDKLLFFNDFADDFIGDFPSKWNTNASGEVVSVNNSPQKWFELKGGYNLFYIPDVPKLPEEYTVEFDVMGLGLDNGTSSAAVLQVILSDDGQFKYGNNFVHANIPFCQYAPVGIRVANRINGKTEINSTLAADIRDEVLDIPHISIAVNKLRYRLWVNETKYVDIPRMVPDGRSINSLKFLLKSFKDGKERIFITNVKVAEGGVDLRRKLISEGKVSTNAILFDSGSANLQPQSMGVIRQISQVLQQESNMNLNIIGHTDSDGEDASNMELSKKRAEAVKNALVNVYNIDGSRISTDGKGETEPVGDNGTADGKAQNRRVEFVKT